jgi:hypothetical protein
VSKHPEQIIAAAKGKVDEEILAAAFAKPRGATTAGIGAGPIPTEIGSRWAGKQHEGAGAAGIELANPGAVAVTPTSPRDDDGEGQPDGRDQGRHGRLEHCAPESG